MYAVLFWHSRWKRTILSLFISHSFNRTTPVERNPKIFPKPEALWLSMTSDALIEHPPLGNTETFDLARLTIPGSRRYYREIKAGPSYIISTVKRRDRTNACLCARLLNTQLTKMCSPLSYTLRLKMTFEGNYQRVSHTSGWLARFLQRLKRSEWVSRWGVRRIRNWQSAGHGIYNSGWNDCALDSAVWPWF